MKRRIAAVHDRLTSGGFVLPDEQTTDFVFEGHAAALIGGEAYCVKCESRGLICPSGGDQRLGCGPGRQTALDGDLVLCKCATKPRIIALLAGESWCEDGYQPSYSEAPSAAQSAAVSELPSIHDEQFTLLDAETKRPLRNVRYRVRGSSAVLAEGVTDEEGRTQRIATKHPRSLQLELLELDRYSDRKASSFNSGKPFIRS